MKFYTTPYHSNLIKDEERLATFSEAIKEICTDSNINSKEKLKLKIAFDIGCGSGILSYFASKYFDRVLAIDIDDKIIDCSEKSFFEAGIENISFINEDASSFEFAEFADLIICEMLDTALIDEEQVIVLNHIQKYLKKEKKGKKGKIIPKGIINIAEPVFMEKNFIHYEDEEYHGKKPKYQVLGDFVKFSEFDFSQNIDPNFKTIIDFKLNEINNPVDFKDKDLILNGIKITTFTLLTDNIICGPTPMLNPPLFVPLNQEKISKISKISKINKVSKISKVNKVSKLSKVNKVIKNTKNTKVSKIASYDVKNKNTNNFDSKISVKLEYLMGGGVENIKANIIH
jgi:predicted RNA methylase